MKIIACHNFYQCPGGEDQVFADETALLDSRGDEVVRFTLHNDAVDGRGKAGLVADTFWNGAVHAQLLDLCRRERPAIVHFHNTFPLMSPAAYYAAREAGAGVVQTLHNYRLFCANGMFFRDGKVCEECLGKCIPWPGVKHACYRNDRPATAVAAGMLTAHRAAGTYRRAIDLYIALTEFSRRKYVQGGLPASRIVVKPNFVGTDRGAGDGGGDADGPFALFVGRLDVGKGLEVMLAAWKQVSGRLKVLGDGPLAPLVCEAAAANPRVQWLGRRPLDDVYDIMGRAAFLVMPSVWYEAMPRTIVEAYSKATPILASRLGAMRELIEPDRTGLHFSPGDADDLARQANWCYANPGALSPMRAIAREAYETKYTADGNYEQLMRCYTTAQERAAPRRGGSPR